MKRLWLQLLILLIGVSIFADNRTMVIVKKDGNVHAIHTKDVDSISFRQEELPEKYYLLERNKVYLKDTVYKYVENHSSKEIIVHKTIYLDSEDPNNGGSDSSEAYSLTINKTSISVGASSASESFSITSNDSWTVSSDVSWIKLSSSSGSGDKTISISIDANNSTSSRSGTVTITGINSGSKTISVIQEGEAYNLTINKTSISVGASSASESISITSNDSWTASSDVSWATLSIAAGSEDKTITVSIEANNSTSSRSGTVTINGTNSGSKTISVTQEGEAYSLTINKTSISVGASSASESFSITSNDSWTASSDVSWATLSIAAGSGDKTITVSIEANNSTSSRSGTVTITGINSGSKTISVIQEGEVISGNYENGYEYVDLGVVVDGKPVYWATTNIGAELPADNGLYFAWGETDGYAEREKHNFDWTNYKFIQDGKSSLEYICKYTIEDNKTFGIWYDGNTFVGDNKKVLDLENDVAHVNRQGLWRMPTQVELDALRCQCNWTWDHMTNSKGMSVSGYKVSNKNDSSKYIFLPASGYRTQSYFVHHEGVFGYYWSSSLFMASYFSYYLLFDSKDNETLRDDRCKGFSVRPVFQ